MRNLGSILPRLQKAAVLCFGIALTLAAINATAASTKCTELHEAVLYRTGGTLLIDQLAIIGGSADWSKIDRDNTGLKLASSDCVAVKEPLVIPQDVRDVIVVNTNSRRFVLTSSLHSLRAEDVADRDSIFAAALPDFSVGKIEPLGGAPPCGARLKREEKIHCAAEALNELAMRVNDAQSAARAIENGYTVSPTKFDVPKELAELNDYTLLRSDIDDIAERYSAYPREVVAPISENTWRAIALTPVIKDGIQRLTEAMKPESKVLQADIHELYPGATLFVVVHRTLPADQPSFSRVFYVALPDGRPPPQATPQPQPPPPQPTTSTIIINEACCTKEPPAHEESRLILAPALLYIPGAHDDSFGAMSGGLVSPVVFVVERTATRDTSLQPGITIGCRIRSSRLSADVTVVPSSPIAAIALGISHPIISRVRLGAGIAFSRQRHLSGMSIGDAIAFTDTVTTSEGYRPHPYLSASVDLRSLCRRCH